MAFLYLTFPLDKIQILKIEQTPQLISIEFSQIPTLKDIEYFNQHLFYKRPEVALKLVRATPDLVAHLKNLTHLKRLWLQSAMCDLEFVRSMPQLEELSISSQENHSLKPLEVLSNLQELAINGKFQHIKSIGRLTNLQKLDINIHYSNTDFLVPLQKLVFVSLSGGIAHLQGIERLKNLKEIHINHLLRADDKLLKPIANVTNLQVLHLADLGLLNDLKWLQGAKLSSLFLTNLKNLKTFEGLQLLSQLEAIALRGTFKYQKDWDLKPLLECKKLKRIDIPFRQNNENKDMIQKLMGKMEKAVYRWLEKKWVKKI